MRVFAFLLMLFPLASHATQANYLMIKLMQPQAAIEAKMENVDGMADYIKQVEIDINKQLSSIEHTQSWGFLVIAVRDDGKIKAWVDTDVEIPANIAKTMVDVAENSKSFSVNKGAVVFALGFDIGNVGLPPYTMPFPNEWKKVANCSNEDCQDADVEAIVLKSWQ